MSSIFTTLVLTGIMQPIEFIRARMMTNKEWKLGWNPRIYYTGFTLTAGRSLPHFSITMCFSEFLKKRLDLVYSNK